MKKYSLAQHTVPEWTPPEIIRNAAAIGYDMVGIRSIAQGVAGESWYDLVHDLPMAEKTRQAIEETGVTIHDIDLIAIGDGTNVMTYEADLEAAADLGIEGVVCSVWTPNQAHYTEQFGRLCELAAPYHLTVNLEFVTWSDLRGLKEANALLDAVNQTNARILLDTLHWHRSGVTFEDLAACPAERFDLIHVCDIAAAMPTTNEELAKTGREERLYPGEGAAEIRGIVEKLPDRVIALEIPNKRRLADLGPYEYAKRCLEKTKSYLGE